MSASSDPSAAGFTAVAMVKSRPKPRHDPAHNKDDRGKAHTTAQKRASPRAAARGEAREAPWAGPLAFRLPPPLPPRRPRPAPPVSHPSLCLPRRLHTACPRRRSVPLGFVQSGVAPRRHLSVRHVEESAAQLGLDRPRLSIRASCEHPCRQRAPLPAARAVVLDYVPLDRRRPRRCPRGAPS